MKHGISRRLVFAILFMVLCISCLILLLVYYFKPVASFHQPSQLFQESDLVGVWEVSYLDSGHDVLTIRNDGTYFQNYTNSKQNYQYKTPWLQWRINYSQDGEIRLHLNGARYFLNGILWAEQNSGTPFDFYDPFEKATVYPDNELILAVESDNNGDLVLYHMWTSNDRGFPLIGGGVEYFRHKSSVAP